MHQGDGRTLRLRNRSVDVAYAFVVMQHVERMQIFEGCLSEPHRALVRPRDGDVGRLCRFPLDSRWRLPYVVDRAELFYLRRGVLRNAMQRFEMAKRRSERQSAQSADS